LERGVDRIRNAKVGCVSVQDIRARFNKFVRMLAGPGFPGKLLRKTNGVAVMTHDQFEHSTNKALRVAPR